MHRSIPMTSNLTPFSLHCSSAEQSFFQGAYHYYYSHVTNYKAETRLIFLDQQLCSCTPLTVLLLLCVGSEVGILCVRVYSHFAASSSLLRLSDDRRAISTLRNGWNTKFVRCTPATFQSSYKIGTLKTFPWRIS